MKILCIGEALIDMICIDQDKTLSEGTNFIKKTGGAPGNVAAAIAAMGGKVQLAAKVGNDPFGHQLIEELKTFGVDVTGILSSPQHFTTMAFVSLLANGERDFIFHRGADKALTIHDIDRIDLDKIAIVHFGSATAFLEGDLQAAYYHLLQKALQKKLFISFDPNFRQALFGDNKESFITHCRFFLNACRFFKMSDEEALLITGCTNMPEAVENLRQLSQAPFAITLGQKGTLFCLNTETIQVNSIPVKAVDTTGAGDAFVGAVLYQLSMVTDKDISNLSKENWINIISNANKAGAKTCEHHGAMEAFRQLNKNVFL